MKVVIGFPVILAAFLAIYMAVGLGFLLYGILFQFEDLRAIADQHGDIWFLIFVGTLIWAWPLLIILMAKEGFDLDSGEELEIIPDPIPEITTPAPDWDGFNAAMLSNTEFNQITGVVLGLAPTVALGIPAALAQVSTNGVTAFALVFNAFCQIGNVSISQREAWANIAESFNLPIEFIGVVRG